VKVKRFASFSSQLACKSKKTCGSKIDVTARRGSACNLAVPGMGVTKAIPQPDAVRGCRRQGQRGESARGMTPLALHTLI
jgi:hypothetical protein